jgi:phospho-N-acetylmuramoyl-pentapeptide-transferase
MHTTLFVSVQTDTLIRVLLLGFLGFLVSMLITPVYTTMAYKWQWWKKPRTAATTGEKATMFMKLHGEKHKRLIPTMAGIIFVVAVTIVTLAFNLKRSETWLPLAAFVGAAGVGLLDDIINIRGNGTGVAGLRSKIKLALTTAFGTYAIIAMLEGRFAVAGFCLTIVGALLSYTWFNIFPARFFMGDVGSFALGTALGVVAMVTDTVLLLPIIGLVFVAEAGSSAIQIASKKLRHGKKVFKIAPIHHHFEALGWPETKVTMRFWVIGQVAAVLGLAVFLVGRYV